MAAGHFRHQDHVEGVNPPAKASCSGLRSGVGFGRRKLQNLGSLDLLGGKTQVSNRDLGHPLEKTQVSKARPGQIACDGVKSSKLLTTKMYYQGLQTRI
jgi:hypothetical protein